VIVCVEEIMPMEGAVDIVLAVKKSITRLGSLALCVSEFARHDKR
jgi:hypothetical protein